MASFCATAHGRHTSSFMFARLLTFSLTSYPLLNLIFARSGSAFLRSRHNIVLADNDDGYCYCYCLNLSPYCLGAKEPPVMLM